MHFFKKALPQKGSALLLVLSLSLAIGIISTALYQSYLHIEILAIKKNNSIELDLALESLVQYTKKGVSSLWCFDLLEWRDKDELKVDEDGQGSFVRECSDLSKFLSHKGNVELLLADEKFKEKLRQLIAQKNAETEETSDDIDTEVSNCLESSQCNDNEKWIEATIEPGNVDSFTDSNPIKPIMNKLASFSDEVKFKISRLGEKTHNLQGRRWIRISVGVFKSSKLIKELSVEYLMYPRQISSYSFLTANELRLNEDVRSISSKKDGHTRISQIDKTKISQYKGLDVFSPVYVNTNIVLPNKSTKFSPVHFKAPVILGKGILKREETDGIKAFSSIDETKFEKKYYTSVDGMSGFSGGIEIRGKKDEGLEKLSDTSISINYDEVYQCVGKSEVAGTYSEYQIFTKRENNKHDKIEEAGGLSGLQLQQRVRNHSKLMIKPLSQEQTSNELTFKYRLRLTPPNRFRSLPFNSESAESLTGITNPLKSILSLRLLSWKYGSKTGGGSYTFSNSKKEDKILLSWKDSFYYKKHEEKWFDAPPDPGDRTVHNISGAHYSSKDGSIYAFGPSLEAWKSEDGLNWTKKASENYPDFRYGGLYSVVKKGNYFYGLKLPEYGIRSIYRSVDAINWEKMGYFEALPPGRIGPLFISKEPYIYILGGGKSPYDTGSQNKKNEVWRSEDGLNWTQIYTPTADDTLELKSDENIYRKKNYSAVIKSDYIYVIGVTGPAKDCASSDFSNIWRYSIKANKWEEISNNFRKRSNPRLFVKHNYIYAMGGACKAVDDSIRGIKDGLWRSIDGSHWEQVDTGGQIVGDEIPVVKEDGSVHFLKDRKSKFFSPARTLLKVKTSPVKEEGFEDSYKNNEIDLSISIKTNKVKNIIRNIHKFDFTAGIVDASGSAYFGTNNGFITIARWGPFRREHSSYRGAPSGFLGMFSSNVKISFYANKPLYDEIEKIKIRKKEQGATWKEYKFGTEKSPGYQEGRYYDTDKYWKEVSINISDKIEDEKTYEVEIVKEQTQTAAESITKNTKFVLDFLPYTLGSNEASGIENTYWNNQHKDFSTSRKTLAKDDNDPSVFSALFKFDPKDFGASTDTYKASEPDAFTFRAADDISSGGYVGFIKNLTLGTSYNRGSSTQTGAPSNFLGMFTGDGKLFFYADTPLCINIKKIKVRKLGSNNWDIYQNFSDCKPANNSLWRGESLKGSVFKKDDTYEVEIITTESEKPATGSLYHDKGVNLGESRCLERASRKGDPEDDNNYIYKKENELEANRRTFRDTSFSCFGPFADMEGCIKTNGGKTDYSYTDWMTIGKSYLADFNDNEYSSNYNDSIRRCAYKSTEEDINGIQTTPCDEKADSKPNPFDALWEEDFLDYTKKSWNFFCSGANGDNAQVRRLSGDKEVCSTGSANAFTIETVQIHNTLPYIGYAKKKIGNYNKGGSIVSGNAPSDFFILRTGNEGIIYYIASESLSTNIHQIKVRKKGETNWKTYTFPEGKGTEWKGAYYKGQPEQGFKFQKDTEYEVEVIKRNQSTAAPRALSEKEYCAYCKPKETLCIGSGSNCDFTISNNLVSKKTSNSAPQFQNRGLYKKCAVNSNADFVAGFFVCENFYIASRSTPLTIIGTVVAGKIDIHKEALKSGVSWMSIYHPKAVKLLQNNGILFSSRNGLIGTSNIEVGFTNNCSDLYDFSRRSGAIWNPNNHEFYKANSYTCSPAYLTDEDQGNPFSWTQVNPDCIQKRGTDGKSRTFCKGRKRHFFMNELSRCLSNKEEECSQ